MAGLNQFELHALRVAAGAGDKWEASGSGSPGAGWEMLPWKESPGTPWHAPLAIAENDEEVFVGIKPETGELARLQQEEQSLAAFRVVRRKLGSSLAMRPLREGVSVNGLAALPLALLAPRDLLVLSPGCHAYVTQRIRPHVGAPTAGMIGQKCPYCRVPVERDTRVVSHRCGVVYHHETAESHPNLAENDRLNCFEKLRACLSCNRPVTLEEFVVWDPATL